MSPIDFNSNHNHHHHQIISPNKMINVVSYSPHEGERGVPITVTIHFNHSSSNAIFVRLVVGSRAVATKVREMPNDQYGRWQLDAIIPPLDPSHPSDKVPLSVQALDQTNQVLDSVTFGEFSYWLSDRSNCASPKSEPSRLRRRHISMDLRTSDLMSSTSDTPVLRRRAATTSGTRPTLPGSSTPDPNASTKPHRVQKTAAPRRVRANSLMRSKFVQKDVGDELYPQTPLLQLLTPLESMCQSWDQSEVRAGRRLVRFQKVQDGRKLIVSCEAIRQEEFNDNDTVISCIYRDETRNCYVTSVDVIYLLERLTNDLFPVEEKNRIRRNLEGLRPTTVSKHKAGFENFFQRIMEFPDPKPRNIEKDLKVFDWGLLGQALEKILSKYSIYTTESSPTDSTVSLPSEPNDDHPPPPYQFENHSHPFPKLAQPSPIPPSLESFSERSALLLSSDPGDGAPHGSEHAYDTLQHYPLYPSDTSATAMSDQGSGSQDGSHFGNWVPENGPPGELGIENYHTLSPYSLAEMSEGPSVGLQNETPEYNYNYSSDAIQFSAREPLTTYYS
ncbi:hypothetical protein VNI00_012034 [Paramarasmius palmivorus]|uniref:DUF7082 domain-containing protein n=1 Tax=Paramarasmius palmivorus TaxID=297713 RepID=A0AAW0CAP1_9AGAR